MEAVIERTAMSPFIREKNDYFAGILDGRGAGGVRHHAAALRQPDRDHLRPVPAGHDAARRPLLVQRLPRLARRRLALAGHGLRGAGVPRRRLVAFSQTWGHFWDIGGLRAGSISPDATEIFHEGIIVPAVRIYREGVLNDEVFRIFLRNSRFPDILRGDIRAVLAGCPLGERRMLELFERFGADTVLDGLGASSSDSAATRSGRRSSRGFPTGATRPRTPWTATA